MSRGSYSFDEKAVDGLESDAPLFAGALINGGRNLAGFDERHHGGKEIRADHLDPPHQAQIFHGANHGQGIGRADVDSGYGRIPTQEITAFLIGFRFLVMRLDDAHYFSLQTESWKTLPKSLNLLPMIHRRLHPRHDNHFAACRQKLTHQLASNRAIGIRIDGNGSESSGVRSVGRHTDHRHSSPDRLFDSRFQQRRVTRGDHHALNILAEDIFEGFYLLLPQHHERPIKQPDAQRLKGAGRLKYAITDVIIEIGDFQRNADANGEAAPG